MIDQRYAFAAILLIQVSLAQARPPASASASSPTPARASQIQVPFENLLRKSRNPVIAYRGATVPPPSMENSARLGMQERNGKIYLSLRDAIALALENNLDLVIARYNLPIALTDVQRTKAGGSVRGVNTGVVSGTPGGGQGGFGTSGVGAGAGGTSGGIGGAGSGASGIVSSTLGTGTSVSSYDPILTANLFADHTSEQLTNFQVEGVSIYKFNTSVADFSFSQAFATGGSLQMNWNSTRLTSNGIYDYFSPSYSSSFQLIAEQRLLAGFGLGPNLRFLHIARTNRAISEIAFRAQAISTVTQICTMYWDLVSAYESERVSEHSVAFAAETLSAARRQLALQTIPELEVLKAEGELATRQQELTVARTNLELQELLMKNAITRSLDDPTLEQMPLVPQNSVTSTIRPLAEPVQDRIAAALRTRTELQESSLDLNNRELSRKTARNALLPSLDVYGAYIGTGTAGKRNPNYFDPSASSNLPSGYGGALESALNNTAPEYRFGLSLSIPLRNRVAKADQVRTELEFRQSQVYLEELKKRIRIEVRNACYALEQSASRVDAARKARDLAQRMFDVMQKEQKLGAGSNQQTLSAEHDLALAESALVTAETAYEKAHIEVSRASGTVLEDYSISVDDAKAGTAEAIHEQ